MAASFINLSGNLYEEVGAKNIASLMVSNTHTSDITFYLLIGSASQAGTSVKGSDASFVLHAITVEKGNTLVVNEPMLGKVFPVGNKIYDAGRTPAIEVTNRVWLARLGGATETADLTIIHS